MRSREEVSHSSRFDKMFPLIVRAQEAVLNDIFARGQPKPDIEHAGLFIHQFRVHGGHLQGAWLPNPLLASDVDWTMPDDLLGDRFSITLLSRQSPHLYSNAKRCAPSLRLAPQAYRACAFTGCAFKKYLTGWAVLLPSVCAVA